MIKIGSVVGNRTVTAMTRQFVLAVSIDNTVPEPWTVWDLDSDGNGVHSGRYFKEQMDAEWDFCSRAFEWFQDNVNINYIEDDEETEEPPAPPEKKSFINKDFDAAVDKMVEELAERRSKNKPATEEKNCGTCGDKEFCEVAGGNFATKTSDTKCCSSWKAKENAPKGEASEQVKANLRKAIVRYGVPKEVILDDGNIFYSAKRYNELNFLSTYQAIAEVWTRMLISSNSKVIRDVIKEICQIKNLKGQPFAREIYAAYEEMIHHNFYKH